MNGQRPRNPAKYKRAIAYLERRVNYEDVWNLSYQDVAGGLDTLRELLVVLGNPEKRFLTVHVAGTKGKGSTCAMLKSVFRQAGYRVGSFSSPHLYSPLERFAVDGHSCRAEEFGELMLSLRDRIKSGEKKRPLTYFELTTLFAFEYFAQKQVDVAVLEVGLGGRLDATNTCSPSITVITNISFDHLEQLGPTLELIAAEKAGIIKPSVPLVAAPGDDAAQLVIEAMAAATDAPSFFLDRDFSIVPEEPPADSKFRFVPSSAPETPFREVGSLTLKLPGEHQRNNAALAVAAAQLLEKSLKVPAPAIRDGLAKAFLPIRVEQFSPSPNSPTFVIDGAHNRASVRALIQTLSKLRPFRKKYLVFGTTLGKDVEGMLTELLPFFDRIVLTQHSSSQRCFPAQGLLTIISSLPGVPPELQRFCAFPPLASTVVPCKQTQVDAEENAFHALEELWCSAECDDLVCVTGSMYLAGELRKHFLEVLAGIPAHQRSNG